MKICNTCGVEKDDSEYYANTKRCKPCTIYRVKANRLANIDYYQEYDRNRPNKQERAKKSSEYQKTEKGKQVSRKSTLKYRENKIKYQATNAVNNALRDGRLIKPLDCSHCGIECNPHGHHDDYSKALGVRWLCVTCHTNFHNTVREKQRELEKQGLSELFDSHKLIKHVAKTYWSK